jgi:hypothetical protein
MSTFAQTLGPTPFGIFDTDTTFQTDADSMVVFVKRMLGDDVLSVELTKKQIWSCFEQGVLEFGALINQYQAKSQLSNMLGYSTASMSGSEGKYPRQTLEFMRRMAEPYAMEGGVGGSFNEISGAITLEAGRQDYDIYTELKDFAGTVIQTSASLQSKLRISEVFHLSPQAAYRFFGQVSSLNYLNNEFSFESFTPETLFYVLPVFEDILRAGQMDISQRVRRSNYGYQIIGTKIRIFPMPTANNPRKLFIRVRTLIDPLNPSYRDDTISGVSSLQNMPYGNSNYTNINSIGKQWIRNYTLALGKELLGQVRSKFSSVPIPDAELTLNGDALISQAREDKDKLRTELKELLEALTYDKLIAMEADKADNLMRQLKHVPIFKPIFMG